MYIINDGGGFVYTYINVRIQLMSGDQLFENKTIINSFDWWRNNFVLFGKCTVFGIRDACGGAMREAEIGRRTVRERNGGGKSDVINSFTKRHVHTLPTNGHHAHINNVEVLRIRSGPIGGVVGPRPAHVYTYSATAIMCSTS